MAVLEQPRPQTRPRRVAIADPDVARMLRVRLGEPAAFAELVERYWAPIVGRFYRQLGDRHEAEDSAQDVFLRLFRARHSYRPTARFSTWLFHIASNVARNAVRTRQRRHCKLLGQLSTSQGNDDFAQRYLPDRHEGPTQPLERAELARLVRRAVAELADRQRAALELQFQDQTYQEIASHLAMTPKAAKSLLYRARQQLRESLGAVLDPT